MSTLLSPLIAYKRGPSHDSSIWYMGSLLTILAESKDTGGAFALVEGFLEPGNEPPPHVHEREDELFYILEGDMDAYVGKKAFQVGPGQCLFLPKLKPHAFVFRSPRMRILVLLQPAGFENYFRTMGTPAEKLELPTGAMTYATSSLEHAVRVGEQHGVRFLSQEEVAKQLPLYYAALKETARR